MKRLVEAPSWTSRLVGGLGGLLLVYVVASVLSTIIRPYLTVIFMMLMLIGIFGWWRRDRYL